jgi:hypothetical protein
MDVGRTMANVPSWPPKGKTTISSCALDNKVASPSRQLLLEDCSGLIVEANDSAFLARLPFC